MSKIKLFFKWSFVFSVLSVWTFFVVQSLASGSADVILQKNFNVPIYIQTSAGIESASSADIIDILFNHNFSIESTVQEIPMTSCSLRGNGGLLTFNELTFTNSHLNFNINSNSRGSGELTSQMDRNRFSLKFEPDAILQTNSNNLIINGTGELIFNRQRMPVNSLTVNVNKNSNSVNINGGGVFQLNNMDATFLRGCLTETKGFYLIHDNGLLPQRRSIEEVRAFLNAHPEFIDAHENLRRLFRDYWFLALPPGIVS